MNGSAFQNTVDLLRSRAGSAPDQKGYIFLADGDRQEQPITYSELDERARAIAVALREQKCQPGDRALLLYPQGLDYIAAFFGCLYAGVIAVPAYPPRLRKNLPDRNLQRLVAIMDSAEPAFALTVSDIYSRIENLFQDAPQFRTLNWMATDRMDVAQAGDWREPGITPTTLAFLQYTSGSTGDPKGVEISHANILSNEEFLHKALQCTESSIGGGWLPLYHDMGLIGQLLYPLYAGYPLYFLSYNDFLQRPYRWLRLISRYRVTISSAPNFAYDLCVKRISADQRAALDLSSWQIALNGAENLVPAVLERFTETFALCGFQKEALFPCYGLAEATLIVSGGPKNEPYKTLQVEATELSKNEIVITTENNLTKKLTLVSSGEIIEGQSVYIVDPESRRPCETDCVGEIWVQSASVARGYWKRTKETEESFHANLAGDQSVGYMRTGDLGFIHQNELFVTGRIKDLIIIRGQNHYPSELEQTVTNSLLNIIPDATAVAFSIDAGDTERLVLVLELDRHFQNKVVLNGGDCSTKVGADQLIETVRGALSLSHQLQVYDVVPIKAHSLPRTSSGKIRRMPTRRLYLDNGLSYVFPEAIDAFRIDAA